MGRSTHAQINRTTHSLYLSCENSMNLHIPQHQATVIANAGLQPWQQAHALTTGVSATPKSSVLFIDAGVNDFDVIARSASPSTEVYLLQSGQEAIAQITQTLLGRSGIESLQIVSHGKSGGLRLGESWLDLGNLSNYVGQLKSWGEALSQDADILLYGCNVGREATGQAFVNLLAQSTGADVAASDDLTGYGGDWELEVQTGEIAQMLYDRAQISTYQNTLGAVNLDVLVNRQSSRPNELVVVNNTILVSSTVGLEIIGATGYPQLLNNSMKATNLTVVGNNAFFVGTDNSNNAQRLWKTDGTIAGTVVVKNIAPAGQTLTGASSPSILANVNGTLFFTANDGTSGLELWKSDGTAAGTVLVKDINPGSAGSTPEQLVAVDNTLFFTATTPANGRELWKSDGTAAGTVLVKEFVSGAQSIDITLGTGANGSLFFKGFSQQQGAELWKSDGTEAGTVLVKDIRTGGGTSQPKDFITIGNTVFFAASTSANGEELWKTDGTEAGTVLVKDIYPGTNASLSTGIAKFVNVNGTLFFRAKDGIHGDELWKSDGTEAGTVMVKDIAVGAAGSDLKNLSSVNGQLYFAANNGFVGEELWRSDGTTAGTFLAAELITTTSNFGGSPGRIVGSGDVIAFSGYGPNLQDALWRYSDSNEIVRFYPSDPNVLLLENGANIPYYRLTRIGTNFAAPLEVQLEIDPSSTASLSDYNLSVTNGSMSINGSIITVTIPANSSDAAINITLIDDTLPEGSETLKLNLLKNPARYATYSQSSVTATIQTNDNNPPSLNNVVLNLTAINANALAPVGAVGTSMTQLVSLTSGTIGPRNVFDANANALTGIALAATDTTNGQWFYTLDNGTIWQPVGTVSNTNALLLPGNESTRLYFQPNPGYSGTIANAITLRAWDQVDGQAGSKVDLTKAQPLSNPSYSWSIASDTASLTVNQAVINTPPSGNVNIGGDVRVNQVLTATNTIADLDGLGSITYQWQESSNGTDWTNLTAGGNFSVTNNQLGKQLRVVASYTDGAGKPESVTSLVTAAVLQALPVNQAASALNLSNTVTTIAEDVSTTTRIKVTDFTITDDNLGTNIVSLSGADANNFIIDGNSLYLKDSIVLDQLIKSSYNVTINVDDSSVGLTPDISQTLTLSITPATSSRWKQLGAELEGAVAGDLFGIGVALSSDGRTLAVGASENAGGGVYQGQVKIYRSVNGIWQQLGNSINGEARDDKSGGAVVLSSDGNIVAIGAQLNDGSSGLNRGHVRIYQLVGNTWQQMGADLDGEAPEDRSGTAIALSSDGKTVAIGAPSNSATQPPRQRGHVRVYQWNDTAWEQLGIDIDGESDFDQSGRSVALSDDGRTLAIGAPENKGNESSGRGHVRVFQFTNSTWQQIGQDIDGEETADLASSVSLSGDGKTVAIGAPYADSGDKANSGHVRIYHLLNNTWRQVGQDIDGEGGSNLSGGSVSLSNDGKVVAIGASFANLDGQTSTNRGHARIYQLLNQNWVQVGQDIDGENVEDQSGRSVALADDGKTVAIGAFKNDGTAGIDSGHVRVYRLQGDLNPDSVIIPGNTAPTISLFGFTPGYTEGNPPALLDLTATVIDNDSPNFDTGSLTVRFSAGGTTDDRLAIRNQGNAPLQIGINGDQVLYGNVPIGTFVGGDGTTNLVINFNSAATPEAVQELVRNLTFANVSDNPSTIVRRIELVLTDGDGETSVPTNTTISVTPIVPTVNNLPTGNVTIAGDARVNQVLTATNTIADLDGLGAITYQWQESSNGIDWTNLATGSNFNITNNQLGKQLRVVASYTDGLNKPESVTSIVTTAVLAAGNGNNGNGGNGNQKSEIIARNKVTGEITILYTDPVTQQFTQRPLTFGANLGALAGQVATVGADWTVSDTADFNGDGIADMLLHNKMGDEVTIWMLGANGTVTQAAALQQNGQILRTQNTNWRVVGFADLDRDSALDIVWHNRESDEVGIWFMNQDGLNVREYDYLREANGQVLKTNNVRWRVEGIGDFDGDGNIDLLFRLPESNQTAIVRLQGKTVFDKQLITSNSDVNLIVEQITDSDNNGTADIYWRNPVTNQVIVQPSTIVNNIWQSTQFNLVANATNAFQAILNAQGQTIQVDLSNWELLEVDEFGR
jgi:ELWxxDGT repeat protein